MRKDLTNGLKQNAVVPTYVLDDAGEDAEETASAREEAAKEDSCRN